MVLGTFSSTVYAKTEKAVLGEFEYVSLMTKDGLISVLAHIDTGAKSSSIDMDFAREMGLNVLDDTKVILNATGKEKRNTVELQFVLDGENIKTIGTISNRKSLTTKLNIGKNDLSGFLVDPNAEFVSAGVAGAVMQLEKSSFWDVFTSKNSKKILLFPVLGALIIVLRLIIGLQTYGVFAPIILAFSFIDIDVVVGITLYVLLLVVGMSSKAFLRRFHLPGISEMVLVMSILSLTFIAIGPFVTGMLNISLSAMTFPIVITAFLIESFLATWEESTFKDSFILLVITLVVASLMGFLAKQILPLPSGVFMSLVFASTFLVFISSRYTGLRISEYFRFKYTRTGKGKTKNTYSGAIFKTS